MFSYLTAGESHGKSLTTIIKKVPSGMPLTTEMINHDLRRRQMGYGRGGRMKIEQDQVEITSGVRFGKTLGSPITLNIKNQDWENWQEKMALEESAADWGNTVLTNPRPGHADLAGGIKYNSHDLRNILERASARETAARTAVGAVARQFLRHFGIEVWSHVIQIGSIKSANWLEIYDKMKAINSNSIKEVKSYFSEVDDSPLRCGDQMITKKMIKLIDGWQDNGDSVGGVFELIVTGLPVSLGSHIHWDEKLDGKLAQGLISIQGIKGVEFGLGFEAAGLPGSLVHDQIYYQAEQESCSFIRSTNRAGGIEGGISNGEQLIMRAAMKPIPTLTKPLHSVDILTKEEVYASKERADICAVPAASVVGVAVVAVVLAKAFLDKFGGDSLEEVKRNFKQYLEYVRSY